MQTGNRTDKPKNPGQAGFTLVELLIAVAVSLTIMAGVATVFIAHSRRQSQQDDTAATQQSLRGALLILPAEMRLAGCDPLTTSGAGIEEATATTFEFSTDIGGKPSHPHDADGKLGDCASAKGCEGERVRYWFRKHHPNCKEKGSPYKKSDPRYPSGVLCRKSMTESGKWGNLADVDPVADNIEHLEFSYVLANNKIIGPNPDGSGGVVPRSQLANIRAVQISMLARAENSGEGHRHAGVFKTAHGNEWRDDLHADPPDDLHYPDDYPNRWVPQDGHRRKLVITTVQMRNMAMPNRSKHDEDAQ